MAGLPTGVEIHNGKLRISFKYKNVVESVKVV